MQDAPDRLPSPSSNNRQKRTCCVKNIKCKKPDKDKKRTGRTAALLLSLQVGLQVSHASLQRFEAAITSPGKYLILAAPRSQPFIVFDSLLKEPGKHCFRLTGPQHGLSGLPFSSSPQKILCNRCLSSCPSSLTQPVLNFRVET